MAERLQLAHEAPGLALGVTPCEVVVARIAVELARREQVPAGAEHPHMGPVGECRRHPPMMATHGLYGDLVSIWPATGALHWCGEHSAR